MKLNLVLTTLCLGFFSFSFAQEDLTSKSGIKPTVYPMKVIPNNSGSQAIKTDASKTSSVAIKDNKTENQAILDELYTLEDERNTIEKNTSLSSSDRAQQIQENNRKYSEKRDEFFRFVESKGLKNVTKQEQSFYLYCLKKDNRIEDYNTGVELIKN